MAIHASEDCAVRDPRGGEPAVERDDRDAVDCKKFGTTSHMRARLSQATVV
jgi:hypothetical protein